jgi:acetolactate synthase-1/2/3 large subunit/5-guanidino-2-oxopentanoate decarboxylase
MHHHRPLGVQIAHLLRAQGVEVVFGVPGVHNQELYRGLAEAGLRHILPRHEQGAGFMADGYARATGRPGVAFVITGPGLTNILTPMGQALSDSVPMLVISSCLDPGDAGAGKGKLHEMKDQEGAAATVADWSRTAADAEGAYRLIGQAFREFRAGRRGPKHVQIPLGLLAAPAPPWREEPAPEGRLLPDPQNVLAAAAMLARARRPLAILGGGATEAAPLIRRLLPRIGAAAVTTYAGRGVVDPAYPLWLGSMLARPGSREVIASADLVLVIGSRLSEVDIWREELGHTGRMIRVDSDAHAPVDRARSCYTVRSDARAFCAALAEVLGDRQAPPGWTPVECAAHRARWRAEIDAERPGILPVCEALRQALPADTVIYSDMTQFAYAAKEAWDLPAPGLWHHPFGFGTLGYALPAAIGGKIALPQRPVVAIAGDYGFQYTMQELGTAAELGLPLPVLLWDNDGLGEIAESMARAPIAPIAVSPRNPDFAALAAAWGARAEAPATLAALRRAVERALEAAGPTLIRMRPGLA